MNRCANRILRTLDSGPRKVNVLRGLAATAGEFERAIGQLVLKGLIVFRGMTKGRLIHLNGRRTG